MKYFIRVTETLSRVVKVEAEDEFEAQSKVEGAVLNGVLQLDCEDGMGTEYEDVTAIYGTLPQDTQDLISEIK